MTEQQAVKHYWDKYRKGEITREQYDKGIEYWKKLQAVEPSHDQDQAGEAVGVSLPCPVTTAGLIEAFGGYEIPVEEPKTQKQKLLNLLSDYTWHDTPNIISAVYGVGHQGVCRISERIRELKADGHDIESRKKSQTVWEYKLNNSNKLI